jgi:tetratricopeptide (TPR) repeat protein
MTSLLVGFGTLAGVVGSTRILAFVLRPEQRARDGRSARSFRRVACWLVGLPLLAACTPQMLRAQTGTSADSLEAAREHARAGRRDQAIARYEIWLTNHPDDARAWRELGIERMRADRYHSAARALERSLELNPDESVANRLAYLRARSRLALVPQVTGTRDSDGMRSLRVLLTAEQRLGDRSRGRLTGTRLSLADGANALTANELGGSVHWRPLHALQLEAGLGALYSTELGTSSFFEQGLRRGEAY